MSSPQIIEQKKSNVIHLHYVWTWRKSSSTHDFSAKALDTVKWRTWITSSDKDHTWIVNLQLVTGSIIVMKLRISTARNSTDHGLTFVTTKRRTFNHETHLQNSNYVEALPITFDMIMFTDTVNYDDSNLALKLIGSKLDIDLLNLLESQKFSDIVLHVNGTEFSALKAILASRSQVFAAMFEHPLEENLRNRIDITDLEREVVEEMLRFIYSGKSPNLHSMADTLLVAADKYALEDLRNLCLFSLAQNIGNDTAVKTLILADLYQADDLKGVAMDFINENAAVILKGDDWHRLKHEYPILCADIYENQYKTEIN